MLPGEKFELDCYEYLKERYGERGCEFLRFGGSDSTRSDIAVIKNGEISFYIEAKDKESQSGQFVLLPDEKRKIFVFSSRNRSKPNGLTDAVISYMNKDFQRFNDSGTAGENLDMDANIFSDWIVKYYEDKHVRYVISRNEDYVIFPIRRFKQYFQITASYRIKKSGSRSPAQKMIAIIEEEIRRCYPLSEFIQDGKKLFVNTNGKIEKNKFRIGNYTYFLSDKQSREGYEMRTLSNTYNMNVIFSIRLVKEQDVNDLEEFEKDLSIYESHRRI